MNSKSFISLLTFVIIIGLGLVGYLFIDQQTKKELEQVERRVGPAPSVTKVVTETPRPKTVNVSGAATQAKENGSLYFMSNKTSYLVGESFNLSVLVNGQGEIVDGVEFIVNFDPSMISVGELTTGAFFSLYPQKVVDNQAGTIRVIAMQKPIENKVLATVEVVSIPVTLLGKGNVTLSFDSEKTHIGAYGGQDLLKEARPLTINVK